VRNVMAWTVGKTGVRPLRNCALLAAVILFAATVNVRAQQSVPTPPAAAPLQSSPAAPTPEAKSSGQSTSQPRKPPIDMPAAAPGAPSFTDAKGNIWRAGDPCTVVPANVTLSKPGVMKRDACQRWYCSTSGVKDIIEIKPNIAELLQCTWRLEGVHCKCRTADYEPSPTK
jgi:hypothetical protein